VKTTPMEHQKEGRKRLRKNSIFYALAAEQGTGKTWMILDDAEYQFKKGLINALLVIAPKGVHTNWIKREIPAHLSVECRMQAWRAGCGKREMATMKKLLAPAPEGVLSVAAMNIDALNTKLGRDFMLKFLRAHRCMLVVDESSRIKSLSSGRTKKAIDLSKWAVSRRIASGTMMPNGPQDLFAQFEFLAPKKKLLGTSSYRAFVAEYTEVEPDNHYLMRHIIKRQIGAAKFAILEREYAIDRVLNDTLETRETLMAFIIRRMQEKQKWWQPPQLAKKDSAGAPIYKNIEKLKTIIAPYTFRVLKKDCLDLPPKIYQTYDFELPKSQVAVYKEAETKLRYERDSGELDTFTALTKIIKLRQIVSGFIMLDGEATTLMEDNPRMKLFLDLVEDLDGQFIVWATFREELAQIAAALKRMDITVVQYHGGVSTKDREEAVDSFQAGKARAFVGQPQSGGIGLTLTAATTAIYYSNDYNSETRLQSEDRCHRIGTTRPVVYIDIVAADTIDERIIAALHRKEETAKMVLNYL